MTEPPLHVLQVSSAARGGGAERVAMDLHMGLLNRGHRSRLAVGTAGSGEPDVIEMPGPPTSGAEYRLRAGAQQALRPLQARVTAIARLSAALDKPGSGRRWLDRQLGREAFDHPGTGRLLDIVPWAPDVIHCHNLHGMGFDLRQLPALSARAPVMLTLHDEWLFTGHCAYSLGCDRWRSGCGECPDLTRYPAVKRDATRRNRNVKQAIYRDTTLHVSAPSRWLLDRARDSILSEGAVEFTLIRNGVDQRVFNPKGRAEARVRLDIPADARVMLFTANQGRSSPYKDYDTVAEAARRVGTALPDQQVILLSLGEGGVTERHENTVLRPLSYEADATRVADLYRAADLYLHAARADNAPLAILEAISCGTPVVATAVGGIPELIPSLRSAPEAVGDSGRHLASATGVVVAEGDAEAMAAAAVLVLSDRALAARLSDNAVVHAGRTASLEHQIDATIEWYREAVAGWRGVKS